MVNKSAGIVKSDFEAERKVTFFVAVRGMVNTKILQALMSSVLLSASNCF